jgi:hypothetical protein
MAMRSKFARWFPYSAAVLLVITAVAKLASAFGAAPILHVRDPILPWSNRWVFCLAAALELTVVLVCFSKKNRQVKSGTIAWLATMFLLYHLGLWFVNYPKPCDCLGGLTDALHISQATSGNIAKGILAYLLIGSYACLLHIWRLKKTAGLNEMHQSWP